MCRTVPSSSSPVDGIVDEMNITQWIDGTTKSMLRQKANGPFSQGAPDTREPVKLDRVGSVKHSTPAVFGSSPWRLHPATAIVDASLEPRLVEQRKEEQLVSLVNIDRRKSQSDHALPTADSDMPPDTAKDDTALTSKRPLPQFLAALADKR